VLFTPELIPEILNRHKRQTRRRVKDVHLAVDKFGVYADATGPFFDTLGTIQSVQVAGRPPVYEVGKTHAVCPGRGKRSVARIEIVAIRRESLQDISDLDLLSEGIDHSYIGADQKQVRRWKFQQLWDKLNKQRGSRWEDNPLVWVLTFALAEVE
jgi:hypothetical protein